MNLLNQILAAREAEHSAPVSQASLNAISQLGTSVGVHGTIAANGYEDRVAALLQGVGNFELLRVYQHNDGSLTASEIEALEAELRSRGIRI